MTACTNNGGKARRVVTAALVGALSVGAVPAIALATGDVALQAVEPVEDATLRAAVDGPDSRTSAKEGDTFAPGSGKYLVPTHLTVDGVDEKVEGNYTLTYTVPVGDAVAGNATDGYVGFFEGGTYYYDREGKNVAISFGNGSPATADITASLAELYFSGMLYDGNGTPIKVAEGAYSVRASKTIDGVEYSTKDFAFKVADPSLDGLYVYDANDGDTTFVFDAQTQSVGIKKSDGTVFNADSEGYDVNVRNSKGVIDDAVEAGTYTLELKKDGESVKNLTFTVQALDLSKASLYVDTDFRVDNDLTGTDTPTRNENFLDRLYIDGVKLNDDLKSCLEVSVAGPSGVTYFDSAKGVYTATLKSSRADDNSILSSGSVTFANVDINAFTSGATIMYGDENVTRSGVVVNLIDGETFDASKLSVRYGGKTYSGDDIEIINCDGADTSEEGGYNFIVRLRAFEAADGTWVGGTSSLRVFVNGADLNADERLYFYLDGKLAGNGATVTYDGGNWLEKLEVVVKDADGNELDPSNYDVTVTKGGKEVDSATDAGDYEVKVTGKTFDFDLGGNDTFYLTVAPLSVDRIEVVGDLDANGYSYLAWTGEELKPSYKFFDYVDGDYVEVEVPAEAYDVTYTMTYDETEDKYVNKKDVVVKDAGTYIATFETAVNVKNYVVNDAVTVRVTKMGVFLDVPMNEWYSQGVYDAAKLGYMNGDGAGKTFSPMRELTRAEAACVLFNMAGGDTMYSNETIPGYNTEGEVYETGFSDVEGNEFFAKAVAWCEATGIINGYADGTFGVSRKVTNEEFACMLANYAKAKNEYKAVDADEVLAAYPDASVVSDWAKDSVAWAVSQKIMGGGANISPAGSILRMRAATMAVNAQPKALTDLVITIPTVNK